MLPQILRFWAEALQPYQPLGWSLDNSVRYENKSLRLRCFTPWSKSDDVPVLILAPNAGHHLNISEPLISRCLKVNRERPVYVVDWIPPTSDSLNRFDSLDDITADVARCVNLLGNKVHLFTLCQGAWAGAIYAALHPDTVLSYTDAAGPIDFCACGGKIQDLCQTLPLSFFQNLVDAGGGVQRGEFQLMGFKSLNPYDRYVGDYLDLWYAVLEGDEKKIQKWHRFKEWYDQPLNLPGAWYVEVVDKLFKRNLLVKGELEVLGERVDLGKISCPVSLIAGENDDITPPDQVFNMANYVTGPVTRKLIANAGHIGVFVKESSLNYWETAIIKNLAVWDSQSTARSLK